MVRITFVGRTYAEMQQAVLDAADNIRSVAGESVDKYNAYVSKVAEVNPQLIDKFETPKKTITERIEELDDAIAEKEEESLDSKGLPWDKRIHVPSRTKNKDGSWRNKKALDPIYLKQVEDELYKMANPVQTPAAPEPTVPVEMPEVVAPMPEEPKAVEVPVATHSMSFEYFKGNLAQVFVQLINEEKINQDYVKQLCEYFSVKNIWELYGKEEQLNTLYNHLCNEGLIK